MIGLLGIGLGIYGAYEMTKEIKTTKQDMSIKKGTGSVQEQKYNIDKYFVDILEYGGATCKIKRIGKNVKITDLSYQGYGGTINYLMEKGYSKSAIDYFKHKYDTLYNNQEQRTIYEKKTYIKNFEQALHNNATETVVKCKMYGTQKRIDEVAKKMIQYMHSHNNPNARVNIIINNTYCDTIWTLLVPNGYDAYNYIEEIKKIV